MEAPGCLARLLLRGAPRFSKGGWIMTTTRRDFIAIGASVGAAAGLGALPAAALAQGATTCTLPTSATPVPFTPRTGPNINRKSAFDPSYDYALLTAAYAKMRALPADDGRRL